TYAGRARVRARHDQRGRRPARTTARRRPSARREDRKELAGRHGRDQARLVGRARAGAHRRVPVRGAGARVDVGPPRPGGGSAGMRGEARAAVEGALVVRFTVELPVRDPDGLMACALAIEQAGFDACFVTDHPAPSRTWLETGGHETLDPFVALS